MERLGPHVGGAEVAGEEDRAQVLDDLDDRVARGEDGAATGDPGQQRGLGGQLARRRRAGRPAAARCRWAWSLLLLEEPGGQVALAGVGQDHHDQLAGVLRPLGDLRAPPRPRRRRRCRRGSPPRAPAAAPWRRRPRCSTVMISSISSVFSTSGTKPGADALDLVRRPACRRRGPASRPARRRSTLSAGLRALSTSATPVMVPPVPTPATRMSTLPSVSRQISSAVVRRWISGLAGFSNCCRHQVARGLGRPAPRPWRWPPSSPPARA